MGNLAQKMSLKECADFVKTQLKLPSVTVYGDLEKEVQKVAVCTGSGKSLIKEVLKHQADVYVTGDADYHFAIDAVAQGVCIMDATSILPETLTIILVLMQWIRECVSLMPDIMVQSIFLWTIWKKRFRHLEENWK